MLPVTCPTAAPAPPAEPPAAPVAPPLPTGRGEHEHGVISPTPDKPRPGGRKNAAMDNTSQAAAKPSPPASDPPGSPADPVAPPPPPRPATPPMDPDDEERHGPESRTIDKPRGRGGRGR